MTTVSSGEQFTKAKNSASTRARVASVSTSKVEFPPSVSANNASSATASLRAQLNSLMSEEKYRSIPMKSPRNANRLASQLFQEVGSLTQASPSYRYPLHRLPSQSGVVSVNLDLLSLQIFRNFSQCFVDIFCCLIGRVRGYGDSHHNSVRANVSVRRIHVPRV